uniref:Uncharacterized protein n=1 Tax=Setaria italica TaxID=4555 RepID=K3YBM8_SETIT
MTRYSIKRWILPVKWNQANSRKHHTSLPTTSILATVVKECSLNDSQFINWNV